MLLHAILQVNCVLLGIGRFESGDHVHVPDGSSSHLVIVVLIHVAQGSSGHLVLQTISGVKVQNQMVPLVQDTCSKILYSSLAFFFVRLLR